MFSILVVEDDAALNRMICAKLKAQDYSVFSAYNGEEALDLLDHQYVDLIISDIMMPVMDGITLIRELREKGFYTEISGAWVKEGSLWIRENGEADLIRVCPVPSGERGADSRSGMLLAGAVDLARRLGMEVLARDIQTEEQKKAMEELGCTCFQGSAVAASTTAEAFIRMIGGEKN